MAAAARRDSDSETTPGRRLVSTGDVRPSERLDYWRHVVSHAFAPLEPSAAAGPPAFAALMRLHRLGSVLVSEVEAEAHTVRRTPSLVARSPRGYYKLGVQTRGHGLLVQDGREALLAPGDLALYDTDRPYTLAFDQPVRMAVFMFPRERLLLGPAQHRRLAAYRIARDDETATLLAPLLARLTRGLRDTRQHAANAGGTAATAGGGIALADAVIDVMSALLAERFAGERGSGACSGASVILLRARTFIENNLRDPDLGPDHVAGALQVSTRYLQKLFAEEMGGGIARWIRLRRLEQCHRDLASAAHRTRPVSAVAAAWGIPDAAHFSRLFKARYGMSPTDFRQRAAR